MQRQNYKGKCTKQTFGKHFGVCRSYNDIQIAYSKMLQADDNVKEFKCNVILNEIPSGSYTSDFMIIYQDDHIAIRECISRSFLTKPKTAKLLDESKEYWIKQGISDWGIVINAEK